MDEGFFGMGTTVHIFHSDRTTSIQGELKEWVLNSTQLGWAVFQHPATDVVKPRTLPCISDLKHQPHLLSDHECPPLTSVAGLQPVRDFIAADPCLKVGEKLIQLVGCREGSSLVRHLKGALAMQPWHFFFSFSTSYNPLVIHSLLFGDTLLVLVSMTVPTQKKQTTSVNSFKVTRSVLKTVRNICGNSWGRYEEWQG